MAGTNRGLNKALGQHWLSNRVILEEIAELAAGGSLGDDRGGLNDASAVQDSGKQRCCVEIGPGLGYLTTSLLRRFEKVVAVEVDTELARKLPGSFPGTGLSVARGDILEFDFGSVGEPFAVAGNIPYYITSPIIEKVLYLPVLPERVVLLMQKEVAERILDARESVLSLFVKNRAEVMAGPVVPRCEFEPAPKVDSQVVVMVPHPPIVGEAVMELVRRGFSAPRKKLLNNLAGLRPKEEVVEIFEKCGLSIDARPADLELSMWQKLYDLLV